MRGDSVWQSEFSSLSVKLLAWEVCRRFWDLECSDRSSSINSPLALHEWLSSLLLGRSRAFTVLKQGSWWHQKQSKKTCYQYCSAAAQAQKYKQVTNIRLLYMSYAFYWLLKGKHALNVFKILSTAIYVKWSSETFIKTFLFILFSKIINGFSFCFSPADYFLSSEDCNTIS